MSFDRVSQPAETETTGSNPVQDKLEEVSQSLSTPVVQATTGFEQARGQEPQARYAFGKDDQKSLVLDNPPWKAPASVQTKDADRAERFLAAASQSNGTAEGLSKEGQEHLRTMESWILRGNLGDMQNMVWGFGKNPKDLAPVADGLKADMGAAGVEVKYGRAPGSTGESGHLLLFKSFESGKENYVEFCTDSSRRAYAGTVSRTNERSGPWDDGYRIDQGVAMAPRPLKVMDTIARHAVSRLISDRSV